MPSADQVRQASTAAPLPVLLLIVSPAALGEASTFGGSIFMQKLAEQLLQQLGGCFPDDEAVRSVASYPVGMQTLSWRCRLRTKYYKANIRALMVQQQESLDAQKRELLLEEPPEAVVFVCSKDEQDQLHEARRSITKIHSPIEEETAEIIEPLPFMRSSFVMQRKRQEPEQEPQLEGKVGARSTDGDDWWVRDVPLKFLISIHCNPSIRRSCCNKSKADSSFDNYRASLTLNGDADTVVWNICGDVFVEGLEVCFVDESLIAPGAAVQRADTATFASSAIAQECQRLRRIAEALQCHMWPGLCRLSTKGDENFVDRCPVAVKRASGVRTSKGRAAGDATNSNEESTHHQAHECGQPCRESGRQRGLDCSSFAAADTDAFDSLAAAMLDLKQRGPAISMKERRRVAMRLATQLAALTMCDEE